MVALRPSFSGLVLPSLCWHTVGWGRWAISPPKIYPNFNPYLTFANPVVSFGPRGRHAACQHPPPYCCDVLYCPSPSFLPPICTSLCPVRTVSRWHCVVGALRNAFSECIISPRNVGHARFHPKAICIPKYDEMPRPEAP